MNAVVDKAVAALNGKLANGFGGSAKIVIKDQQVHMDKWCPVHGTERVLIDGVGRPTPVNAGQGVGSVTTSEPAGAVLDKLARGAEDLLRRSRGYVD